MLRKRFSKWIPIHIYDYSGNKFLLLGRINLRSGMMCFKAKRLHRSLDLNHNMPVNIFDPSIQFDKLLNSLQP